MKTYRGAFHLHSRYSYDGQLSLQEIVPLLKKKGVSFALMTEHAYHRIEKRFLSTSEFSRFIQDCQSQSSPDFLLIPGLEFACHNNQVHIVGTPLQQPFSLESLDKPDKILEAIRREGGLAILVHPFFGSAYRRLKKEEFLCLDGFEIWNYGYQGLQGPSLVEYLKFSDWLKTLCPDSRALVGMDLHHAGGIAELYIELELEALKPELIFQKIRERSYRLAALQRNFSPQGELRGLLSHLATREVARIKRIFRRIYKDNI